MAILPTPTQMTKQIIFVGATITGATHTKTVDSAKTIVVQAGTTAKPK